MKQTYCLRKRTPGLKGFTLVELMLAAVATVAIIGAAGYGLINIVSSKNTADASSTQRKNLDQSLNYITDEVRSASAISTTGSTFGIIGFPTLSTGSQVVLVLTVPNLPNPIVYYVSAAQSPWLGPNNIVRWGPDVNTDGSYNTSSYNARTLVDLINTNPSGASTNCTAGWSAVPGNNLQGFFACIAPSGKVADVYLGSQFVDGSGNVSTYNVNSRMYSRSVTKLPSS
jgi:type II secretory pathway pseudopilin PulG